MESYPRQCRAGDQTFTEKIAGELFECSEESRKAEVCAEIYQPVCATVQVQCLTTPCDALLVTYPNACDACRNLLVTQYTEGECE
ncbi:hypothetical protein KKG31_03020 [Patescibacteria group bacterium]|nr:hypothetical protein [Patescibacteria group bacterium]MBU1758133.1 hypothetical protein [Patescibacteria group bacterium]